MRICYGRAKCLSAVRGVERFLLKEKEKKTLVLYSWYDMGSRSADEYCSKSGKLTGYA